MTVLTLSAGYADAVAFFGLGTFTANMTGNTVLLGATFARLLTGHPAPDGLGWPALSVAAFAIGVAGATALLRGDAANVPVRSRIALAVAAALLVGAAFAYQSGQSRNVALCVVLLSATMGLQSVVGVRSGVRGVSSAYVTGTLVTAVSDLIDAPVKATRVEGGANWMAWALYFTGATAGSFALDRLGAAALWPAAGAFLILLAIA